MATLIDIAQLLDSSPDYWGGRPFVRGKGITVQRIAIAHQRGESPAQIAEDYELEPAEVHAALTFYYLHKAEMDSDIAAYDAETERLAEAVRANRR